MGTLLVEGCGACVLSLCFVPEYGLARGIYMGIFHAVSAFCNAGFDIVGPNSLTPYVTHPVVNITIILLIVIGGLGFTVWRDFLKLFREYKELPLRVRLTRLQLHSKFVFIITPVLLVVGMLVFLAAEYHNPATLGDLTLPQKFLAALFQSTTARTAGFNSISQGELTYASKFMTVLLMFIGGSPVSTAGGIKTVTLGVLFFTVYSVVKGRRNIVAFNRTLSFENLQRALSVFLISLAVLVGVTMLLTVTEKHLLGEYEFIDLLYETASALGTTGLTTGLTPQLSSAGKLLMILSMFMGRLGPVTIVISLAKQQSREDSGIEYPEESVMIG